MENTRLDELEHIVGTIEKIIYKNENNGYTVCLVKTDTDIITVVGVLPFLSNGDAAKLTKAKNTIIYSVIGLVVALLAFAIVNFVLANVFSSGGGSAAPSQTQQINLFAPLPNYVGKRHLILLLSRNLHIVELSMVY